MTTPAQRPAATPAAVASNGEWPPTMSAPVTAAPSGRLPSTVRSGKSSTRKVMKTPNTMKQ